MKKSLLAIGLALASTPFIFAAPQASTTAPAAKTATTQKTKKHVKKGHKAPKATKPAAK
ncbi:MAG: hypothetical protein LAP40_08435 [Acidobacteriia bacterium]|nr:hypothetical protein [Terriglobia bacterium]